MRHEQTEEAGEAYDYADDGDSLRRENGSELFNRDALAETQTGARRGVAGIAGARQMVGDTGERTSDGAPEVGRTEGRDKTRSDEGDQKPEETAGAWAGRIDPLTLPYVALSELRYLPTCAGIYFAIEEGEKVAYIGQSLNIRQRWRAHTVAADLCEASDLAAARRIRLAWLAVEDVRELDRLERSFIREFRPRLNQVHNGEPTPIKVSAQRRAYTPPRKNGDEPEMLTPRQFAAKHGVAYTTVMKWLYAELLKGAVKQASPFGEGYYYKIPANCPRPTRKPGVAKGTKLKRKSSGKKTVK